MAIQEALDFLIEDAKKAKRQWAGGEPLPFMSLLQRNDKTFSDLLQMFDASEDESAWSTEYEQAADPLKLQIYRKRLAFLKGSRKEFYEEYDPERTDVDFMRLLELPFTEPTDAMNFSKEEMKDPK